MNTLLAKRYSRVLSFCLFVFLSNVCLQSQTPKDVSVLLGVKVVTAPRYQIELNWPVDSKAQSYQIGRKQRVGFKFEPMQTLGATASTWIDSTAEEGIAYEYGVIKTIIKDSIYGVGYIAAGSKVPVAPSRGQALILVDNVMSTELSKEIKQLADDYWSEGWTVTIKTASRTEKFNSAAVLATKQMIRDWYESLDGAPATLFLVGRIAVPYSGMVYDGQVLYSGPDGHPEHAGAWAADTYYATMADEIYWTDDFSITAGIYPDNKNLPGDGRYDNAFMPGLAEIRVGRLDMYNMGLFYKVTKVENGKTVIDSLASELELLRAYLNRDHSYRSGNIAVQSRGLIDNNFGYFPLSREAFALCGWYNFSSLLGRANIFTVDYISTLDTSSYLWSFGCGPGGSDFQSCGGVGTSKDISGKHLNTIFSMLFGSYFGDWDKANSLTRAPLAASPGALTNCWAGRPYWFFHNMALGESVGDATALSESNNNTYQSGIFPTGVHMALMGDPTLRMLYGKVQAPRNLAIAQVWNTEVYVELKWNAPQSGPVAGYYLYKQNMNGQLDAMNGGALITDTVYRDKQLFEGNVRYVVRTVGLLNSSSGSFYDLSAPAELVLKVTPVEELSTIETNAVSSFPNPVSSSATIRLYVDRPSPVLVQIYTANGQLVQTLENRILNTGEQFLAWDVRRTDENAVENGVYFLRVAIGANVFVKKISVLH